MHALNPWDEADGHVKALSDRFAQGEFVVYLFSLHSMAEIELLFEPENSSEEDQYDEEELLGAV